jgi:pimeloyl-ACP methyl ester carboxylesterase
MTTSQRILFLAILWGNLMTTTLPADDDPSATPPRNLNLATPTLGGKQFWTDFAWNNGWRLQQHAVTGHWRVLDPHNIRRCWGERASCQAEMDAQVDPERAADDHVIVMLHGLLRSSGAMKKMGLAIERAEIGRPVAFGYASTRNSISQHAVALRQWLESLPGKPRIDFVCHSMGNIVVRHLIADLQRDGDPAGLLDRMGRFAMLGPPNQGADIARQLGKLGLFEIVTGRGGMELGPAWEQFQQNLATPPFPFIIVAGDTGEGWFRNPLFRGPSDLVVRVDEARLPGSQATHLVSCTHTFLMNHQEVQEIVIKFLSP